MAKKFKIKKGDSVQVVSGKDKGKTGEVLRWIQAQTAWSDKVRDRLLEVQRAEKSRKKRKGRHNNICRMLENGFKELEIAASKSFNIIKITGFAGQCRF